MRGLYTSKTPALALVCAVASYILTISYLFLQSEDVEVKELRKSDDRLIRTYDMLMGKINNNNPLPAMENDVNTNYDYFEATPLSGHSKSAPILPASAWVSVFYPDTFQSKKNNGKRKYARIWNPNDDSKEETQINEANATNETTKEDKLSFSVATTKDDQDSAELRGSRNKNVENHDRSPDPKKHKQKMKMKQSHSLPSYTGEVAMKTVVKDSHGCVPVSKWHQYVPTTCNVIHEIDFRNGLTPPMEHLPVSEGEGPGSADSYMRILHSGGARDAWLVESNNHDGTTTGIPVIVKTLRWIRDFTDQRYSHQLVDALATERLTASPYVVNTYGYCGMSAINEYADGGDIYHSVIQTNNKTQLERLILARDAALGLADIHGIDGPDHDQATMVHHDIRSNNFLMVHGRLKFHDFNQAQTLTWNPKTKQRCGFFWTAKCSESVHKRAPEECLHEGKTLTEKVETYRLGTFFFNLLTNSYPYHFEAEGHKKPLSEVLDWVLDKKRIAKFPQDIQESKDPATIALVEATRYAMTYDPKKRPTTKSLANYLVAATEQVMKQMEK